MSRRALRRRRGVALLIALFSATWLTALQGTASALPSGCSVSGQTVTCAYNTQGQTAQFTVPAGLSSIQVSAVGGAGNGPGCSTPCGGAGAHVTGAVPVTGGEVLNLQVAGNAATNGTGGAGGGGGGCGGGGGASVVFGISGPLIVAGGGGGNGCAGVAAFQGDDPAQKGGGAGAAGSAGVNYNTGLDIDGGPGLPGTQTAAGTGGAGGGRFPPATTDGQSGAFLNGGAGGTGGAGSEGETGGTGGGGGSGLFGGGGGGGGATSEGLLGEHAGAGGGGGGGWSLVPSGGASGLDTTGVPEIVLSYVPGPPTASIVAPASGGTYGVGQSVATSFSCTDASGAPGIAACTDSDGVSAPTGSLNTATAGAHTYTVKATSQDGETGTGSITYTVVAPRPPTASISSPASGGTYTRGQQVATNFSCADAAGAPGIASCLDSNHVAAPSGALDTSTLGAHTYTVTATSRDGATGGASINYMVVAPPPSASIASVSDSGATELVNVACQGDTSQTCSGGMSASASVNTKGGLLARTGRAAKARKPAKPTTKIVTVAEASFTVAAGQTATVKLALNATGRKLLSRFYTLHAALTFTGIRVPPEAITYSYPLVTGVPNSSWVSWSWVGKPCSFCWTSIFKKFSIPRLLPSATVRLSCNGALCPAPKSYGPGRRFVDLTPLFARKRFAPGVVIELQITAPQSVGRVITWTTVAGFAPAQRVLCVPPGDRAPVRCAK
jgi:hypothetical protein